MTGLDILGADTLPMGRPPMSLSVAQRELALSAGGGVLGLMLWRRHPILGLLTGFVLAGNAHSVATKNKTWWQAGKRVACHGVAVAGSLAVPEFPAMAYILTSVAANLLIDRKGIAEEWEEFRRGHEEREIVDVTPVEPDHQTKALVKRT